MNSITWYPNVTRALESRGSLLRQHLEARYPHHKDVCRRYRDGVGPLLVEPGDAFASTLGTAFDWLVRFLVQPHPNLGLAAVGAYNTESENLWDGFVQLAEALAASEEDLDPDAKPVGGSWEGPSPLIAADEDLILRAVWALALFTEVYRGGFVAGSPLLGLAAAEPSIGRLLALAPDDGVRQLREMRKLADGRLISQLRPRRGTWSVGPTFDGSLILKADGDLIAGGALLDIKTALGGKRKDGGRYATLPLVDLWQVITYALMDFSDTYQIADLGIYAARYGHLTTWALGDLLAEMRGCSVGLVEERRHMEQILRLQQGA